MQLYFDACIHRKTNPVGFHHSMEGMQKLEFLYTKSFSLEQWFLTLLLEGHCHADFSSNLPHHTYLEIYQQDNCCP